MARETRTHVDPDNLSQASDVVPKSISKQEFAKRLYKLMLDRGWRQSDLARNAGLNRDAVSVYVRGRSFPTPQSLDRLARALNVSPTDLLPNHTESAITNDTPSLEIKTSTNAPGMAWLRINQLCSLDAALKVAEILQADRNVAAHGV